MDIDEHTRNWMHEVWEKAGEEVEKEMLVENLEAEIKRLKGLLQDWLNYIDADENISPPLKETRKALKTGRKDKG